MESIYGQRFLALGLALLMLPVAGPWVGTASATSAGASDTGERPLFVSTFTLDRLEGDPWRGGAWIAMGTGLVFKSFAENDAWAGEGQLTYIGLRDGLPDIPVRSLAVTPQRVYVGTDGGIAVLDKATGRFHNVTYENGTRLDDAVYTVSLEGETLWAGTAYEGMFRVDTTSLVAEPVENPHSGDRFTDAIMDFAFDGAEMFISVNNYGVVRWDRDTGETERYHESARVDEPLYFRMALTDERVWVGTSFDGAISYDRETGEARHYTSGDTLKALNVFDIEYIGDNIWFTTDSGIARYDRGTQTWHNYQSSSGWPWGPTRAIEMINGTVYAMARHNKVAGFHAVEDAWERVHWWHEDKVVPWGTLIGCTEYEDKLLYATAGGASWFYDPTQARWTGVHTSLGDPETGPPEILHRDAAADERALWVATDDGLGKFNRSNQTWTTHESYADYVNEQAYNRINDVDLTEDSVWVAAMTSKYGVATHWATGHVARMDRNTGEWTRWNETHGLSGGNVTQVVPVDGRIFAGITNGGIDVLDPANNTVQHVYPSEEREIQVSTLARHAGHIWAATTDGLLKINTTTLDVERPEPFRGMRIYSVLWDNGRLWVGGMGNGLHRWDPATDTLDSFTISGDKDIWGYCMIRRGDILYVGTQRGLDRFDVQREMFLPKYGHASLWMNEDAQVERAIEIQTPPSNHTAPRDEPLTVTGTASGPEDVRVQVRVGGSPWAQADGAETWSASLSLEDTATGPTVVSARLIQGADVLVQAARTINVQATVENGSSAANGSRIDPSIRHDPVLEQEQGEAVPLQVSVDPPPRALQATLRMMPPGEQTPVEHELEVGEDGTVTGTLPAFKTSGMAAYQIRLTWDGGSAYLPRVDSAYGTMYPLAVRAIEGIASARLVHTGEPAMAPGSTDTLRVSLQNTGTRVGTFNITYGGPASAWLDDAPQNATVEAGASTTVSLPLSIPSDAQVGDATLTVEATPFGLGDSKGDEVSIPLMVQEPSTGEATSTENGGRGASNPAPVAGLPVLLAAIAGAAVIVHRRSAKD